MSFPLKPNLRKVLLIVEDQILLALNLKDDLEDGGYQVLDLADRHQEALGLAREIKPDLALVNIDLAGGDDGVALAHDLKALGVPVMFISGQADRARLGMAFAVASLSKPYSGEEMVDAVDYLFRHEDGDESRPRPARLEVFDAVTPVNSKLPTTVAPIACHPDQRNRHRPAGCGDPA